MMNKIFERIPTILDKLLDNENNRWERIYRTRDQYSGQEIHELYSQINKKKLKKKGLEYAIEYFLADNEGEVLDILPYYLKYAKVADKERILIYAIEDNAAEVVSYLLKGQMVEKLKTSNPSRIECLQDALCKACQNNAYKVVSLLVKQPEGQDVLMDSDALRSLLLICAQYEDNRCGEILLQYQSPANAELSELIQTIEANQDFDEAFYRVRQAAAGSMAGGIALHPLSIYTNTVLLNVLKSMHMAQQFQLILPEYAHSPRRKKKI